MAHQHLSLQSLHSLQSHAHHDDDGGAADGQVLGTRQHVAADNGQEGNDCQIQGAEHQDLVDDLVDEVSGGLAGTEAGDKSAVLLQVVGNLHRIVLDGGVEPAEEEDQQEVEHPVDPAGAGEHVLIPPAAGVAGEGTDGSGDGHDGLGKDHRQHTGHAHLDGQVGALTAVDLPAHHTLGVLNGNPALGIVDENNEYHQKQQGNHNDEVDPPGQVNHGIDHAGQTGDDIGKENHGDAVADTELGDLLTQPHHHGRTGGEGADDHDGLEHTFLSQHRGAVCQGGVCNHGVVGKAQQDSQTHGGVPGNLGDLLLPFLALFLGHPLQSGNGHGEQLDDNGSVNVGLDAQSQYGRLREGGAGHGVVKTQHSAGQGLVEVVGHGSRVHEGHGNHIANAVQQQNQQGEHELLPQLGNSPRILKCLEHLNHLGLSACLLDFFLCRLRKSRSLYSDFLGQGAVGQNLQTMGAGGDDTGLDESLGIHHCTVFKAVEHCHVDSGQGLCKDVVETALGNPAHQRHLAAFEAGTDLAAGASLLTLVAAAAGLTVAGADAPSLALAYLGRTSDRREFMQIHNLSPPYSTSVTCSR